jgi:hypothetical protein
MMRLIVVERRIGMPRRPGDTEPEPPGGRAAERLREFVDQRFPGGSPPREGKEAEDRDDEQREERGAADREGR